MELLGRLFSTGGFSMYPLLLFSLVTWGIVFERLYRYRKLQSTMKAFHLEAINALLRKDPVAVERLCRQNELLPSSRILSVALERLGSNDSQLKKNWAEAMERRRKLVNHDLRSYLWILGTIAASSPFIGLFGTVVGILRSFGDLASAGKGGFAIVAGGISESLVATAAGIIVAVIAVLAFNAFQTQWSSLVLMLRLQMEEWMELIPEGFSGGDLRS